MNKIQVEPVGSLYVLITHNDLVMIRTDVEAEAYIESVLGNYRSTFHNENGELIGSSPSFVSHARNTGMANNHDEFED